MKTVYAIKKNGKYLDGLFPITFGADHYINSYRYSIKQIAVDIAKQLKAHIEPVKIGKGYEDRFLMQAIKD